MAKARYIKVRCPTCGKPAVIEYRSTRLPRKLTASSMKKWHERKIPMEHCEECGSDYDAEKASRKALLTEVDRQYPNLSDTFDKK